MIKCCQKCSRLNSACNILRGEPARICVDESCDCHPEAPEIDLAELEEEILEEDTHGQL